MPAHSNNTLKFEELNYSQQASSINAQINNLENAILAHRRRANLENRNVTGLETQMVAQVQRLLERIGREYRRQ